MPSFLEGRQATDFCYNIAFEEGYMATKSGQSQPTQFGVIAFSDLAQAPDMRMDAGYHLAVKKHAKVIRQLEAALEIDRAVAVFERLPIPRFAVAFETLATNKSSPAPSKAALRKSPHLYLALALSCSLPVLAAIDADIDGIQAEIDRIDEVLAELPDLPTAAEPDVDYHSKNPFTVSMSDIATAPGGRMDPLFHLISRYHKNDAEILKSSLNNKQALAALARLPLSRFAVIECLTPTTKGGQPTVTHLATCPHLYLAMIAAAAGKVKAQLAEAMQPLEDEKKAVRQLIALAALNVSQEPSFG